MALSHLVTPTRHTHTSTNTQHPHHALTHAPIDTHAPDVVFDGVRHHGNRAVTLAVLWVDWSCGGGRRKLPASTLLLSNYSFCFGLTTTAAICILHFCYFSHFKCKIKVGNWKRNNSNQGNRRGSREVSRRVFDYTQPLTWSCGVVQILTAATKHLSGWRLISRPYYFYLALSLAALPRFNPKLNGLTPFLWSCVFCFTLL